MLTEVNCCYYEITYAIVSLYKLNGIKTKDKYIVCAITGTFSIQLLPTHDQWPAIFFLFPETLKAALRDLYSGLTIPFQHTVDDYSGTEAALDDMFAQQLLQQYNTTHLPETPLEGIHQLLASRSVLILGQSGVGKSTFMKQMAVLWAKGKLWKDIEFLFLITLQQLQQGRKWTLEDLLLDGLPLGLAEKRRAVELLMDETSRILFVREFIDEVNFQNLEDRDLQGDCYKDTHLSTVPSNVTCHVMAKEAKFTITFEPNNNVLIDIAPEKFESDNVFPTAELSWKLCQPGQREAKVE